MKKFFTLFLALVATTSFSTLSAETLSFETDEEISHWHFINGSQPNYWTIGTAAGATDGSKALYTLIMALRMAMIKLKVRLCGHIMMFRCQYYIKSLSTGNV